MRSHIINIKKKPIMCVTMEEDNQHDDNSMGYVLRKKNKKNTFYSDPDPNHKVCSDCGKQFFSWKSLFAHIKSHSHKEEMSFSHGSWIAASGDDDDDCLSENETAPSKGRRSKRRTRSSNATNNNNNNNNNSSSVSEIDQIEQEEVAMSLMMLSRDVTNWGGASFNNSVAAESSDNTSELILEFKNKKKKKKKQNSASDNFDSKSRSKFECTTCNKIFHSYQALGGHRASHKKTKGCFASTSRAESKEDQNNIDNNIEACKQEQANNIFMINHIPFNSATATATAAAAGTATATAAAEAISKKKVGGGHECPICLKVFSSGQALGGHKRSHLLNEASSGGNHTVLIPKPIPGIREFLDLNMPAPVEEEGFNPWWRVGSSHKHETLVGLI